MGNYVCTACGNGFSVGREGTLIVACPTCGIKYRVDETTSTSTRVSKT